MSRPIRHLSSKRVIFSPQVKHTLIEAVCHAVEQDDMTPEVYRQTAHKACTAIVYRRGRRPRVEVIA